MPLGPSYNLGSDGTFLVLDKVPSLCYGMLMELENEVKRVYLVRDIVAGFIIGLILAVIIAFARMH